MKKSNTRSQRTRYKLKKVSSRPRLSVFRSNKHIYAQIIDDKSNETLVSASTVSKELKGKFTSLSVDAAKSVGQLIAEKAKTKNVEEVYFDRGPYPFHGRVKALAEAARETGLKF